MAPKVSVVVPVCNVERYLPQCLDSLVNQTLRDIEIIVVDDGSTDGSLAIMREYADRDSRIEVLTKENRGYGHTMNLGFSKARGEYIGIVESDDCAAPDMFEKLYEQGVRNHADIVRSNYWNMSDNGGTLALIDILGLARAPYYTAIDAKDYPDILRGSPAIWTAIYRRDFVREKHIRFLESPGASYQDTGFALKAFTSAERIVLVREAYLRYRIDNAGSSVKSGAKVFCVSDEYAGVEEFLAGQPNRLKAFRTLLPAKKYETYVWNFNRLDDVHRSEFAQRMVSEFQQADAYGDLDRNRFQPIEWTELHELMDDPSSFDGRDLTVVYPPLDFRDHQKTRLANGELSRWRYYASLVRHALSK